MKIALQGVVDSVTPGGVDYSLYLDVIIAYLGRKIKGLQKKFKKIRFLRAFDAEVCYNIGTVMFFQQI